MVWYISSKLSDSVGIGIIDCLFYSSCLYNKVDPILFSQGISEKKKHIHMRGYQQTKWMQESHAFLKIYFLLFNKTKMSDLWLHTLPVHI